MIGKYEITIEPEENYYEELLSNFLEHHSKQEIKNILLIEALYEEKAIWIPKQIEKGEIK